MRKVLIIGGGVAGLAAAVRLAEYGYAVTLLEKRSVLGGRASSFIDPATGERVDNCQHVTMRCCTNLEDFYRRIGVLRHIRYYRTLEFLDAAGRRSVIGGSFLPPPLHTLPSFLRFRSLGWKDKAAVARGLLEIARTPDTPGLDDMAVSEWLSRTGQTDAAVRRFWLPILVGACNAEPHELSCRYAFMLFRTGFLGNRHAYELGLPTVSLADLYTEPVIDFLEARGGRVCLRQNVARLCVANDRITGATLADGSLVEADAVVAAVPFDKLVKLLPPDLASHRVFANAGRLRFSPIVGVHLWFDRPLRAPDAVALLDRKMHWIFNKGALYSQHRASGEKGFGAQGYLGCVVSAAYEFAAMPREEVAEIALRDVHACVPDAREAKLVRWHVIKERKATICPEPGADRFRPPQAGPIPNLFIAGDWTRTGWPSTMEGAVRSGYLAAEALMARDGREVRLLAPDLPLQGLSARLMERA
ncbi:MAG: hydroxysqualene dehydroxylase HpnE [Chthonomonadales bacterium]